MFLHQLTALVVDTLAVLVQASTMSRSYRSWAMLAPWVTIVQLVVLLPLLVLLVRTWMLVAREHPVRACPVPQGICALVLVSQYHQSLVPLVIIVRVAVSPVPKTHARSAHIVLQAAQRILSAHQDHFLMSLD